MYSCRGAETERGHRAREALQTFPFPHCFVISARERARAVPSALKTITHFIK